MKLVRKLNCKKCADSLEQKTFTRLYLLGQLAGTSWELPEQHSDSYTQAMLDKPGQRTDKLDQKITT